MPFGQRLKSLLEERGIAQVELAQRLNLAKSTVSQYVSGHREPDMEMLQKIAAYFSVSTDYLLGRTNDPMPPAGRKAPEEPVNPLQKRLVDLGVYLRTNKDLTEEDIKEIEDFIEYRRQKRMQAKRNKGDGPK